MIANDTINQTSIQNHVIEPRWAEVFTAGVLALIFGSVGTLVNAICPAIIYKNKNLHTPCFFNIAAHSILFSIMSIGYLTNGIDLCGASFNLLNLVRPRGNCYLVYLTMLFSIPASGVMTFSLSIDRMLGILYPLLYRKTGHTINVVFLVISLLAGFICSLSAGLALLGSRDQLIFCAHFLSPYHPAYIAFHTTFVLSCYLGSVLLYMWIIVVVERRKLLANVNHCSHSSEMRLFLKHQLNTLPMVKLLAIIYSTLGMVPPLLCFLFFFIDDGRYSQRGWYYAHMAKVLLATVEFLALATKSSEFRETLRKTFQWKSNQVIPILDPC